MNKSEQEIIDKLFQLIEMLRSNRNFSYNEINQLILKPAEPYFKEKNLVQEIILEIKSINPQLSSQTIFNQLISNSVYLYSIKKISTIHNQKIHDEISKIIGCLLHKKNERYLDIPLTYLEVGDCPFQLGCVTYHRIDERDKYGEWWEAISRICPIHELPHVNSFAKVYTIGDRLTSYNFAEEILRENLRIIRAIGFPFSIDDISQFGIIGEFTSFSTFPIRENKNDVTLRIGNPFRVVDLNKHILNNIGDEILHGINDLLIREEKGLSALEKKYMEGLKWLGEATKPDSLESRIIKLTISLEFFIGGESSSDYLTTRGITASVAERAAFLCSEDFEIRDEIDRKIRNYYSLRSGIVHGNTSKNKLLVNGFLEEFISYGNTVREIAFSLLPKLKEYKTIDDLQRWVQDKRYS